MTEIKDETQGTEEKDNQSEKTNDSEKNLNNGHTNEEWAKLRITKKALEDKEKELVELKRSYLVKDLLAEQALPPDFSEFVTAVDEEGIKAQITKLASKFDNSNNLTTKVVEEKTKDNSDKPKPPNPPAPAPVKPLTNDELLSNLVKGIKK